MRFIVGHRRRRHRSSRPETISIRAERQAEETDVLA
jgi:hypothetical protein